MKSVFRYLVHLNYVNTILLVMVALITVFLQNIYSFQIYITAFLTGIILVMLLLSPVLRFKNIVFGESKILFLTPKPYSSILIGYLLSELIFFIIYFLGFSVCLFSLHDKITYLSYLNNLSSFNDNFISYCMFIFINTSAIWLLSMSIGVISVILSGNHILEKINFLSIKIIVCFAIIQCISFIAILLMKTIVPSYFIKCILSIYILYLSYRKMLTIDIH